jgi:hypothetical protein
LDSIVKMIEKIVFCEIVKLIIVIDLLISGQQDGRNLILFYIETYGFFLHSLFPGGIKAILVWCITILAVLTILK